MDYVPLGRTGPSPKRAAPSSSARRDRLAGMRPSLLWLLALPLVALGCGDDDRPPPPRGVRGVPNPGPAPEVPPEEIRRNDRFRRPAPDRRPAVDPSKLRPLQLTKQRPREQEPTRERDYAPELQAAAGSPMACGSLGGLTGEIRIPLSATVSTQGVVTRAIVGGPIPAETRRCMQRKIERHRFGPIPDGPKSISATLVVVGRPGETTTEEVSPMTGFPLGPGQQPAQGPAGRPIAGPGGRPIGSPRP